jgi:tripartite ATP-independent transporter DctM subunit
MITVAVLTFMLLLVLGVPVAFAIGAAGLAGLLWSGDFPLIIIMQQVHQSVDSFVLLAIPLFIFAGMLMETGGIAIRLVRLAQALVGWIRGGLAMAVVIAEYIFSGVSGSTIADVSAIGATVIPPMTRSGYRPAQAVSIVAAASAMGILVPPCILMIVLGSIANVSVAALFVAGFIPAIVLAAAIMAYIYWEARRAGFAPQKPASAPEIGRALKDAVIPLGLPTIIFGGILGGVVTPTEAAALAVLYAFVVGVFVYREIKWRDLPGIMTRSAVVTGTVCFLLAVAAVIAWMLAVAQVPAAILAGMQAISAGPITFLVLNAVLFILLGAVLEGLPAVVILVPAFLPVVKQMGIDLIHYSIVVTAATGIGLFLPPIGVGLLMALRFANISVGQHFRAYWPYLTALVIGLLILIIWPEITLFLPRRAGLVR